MVRREASRAITTGTPIGGRAGGSRRASRPRRLRAGGRVARVGAVLVSDGVYCLLPAEPGAGLGHFAEPVWACCLADLADARLQAKPSPQAFGRPGQQRRPVGVAFGEREPGERDDAQGHADGAVGLQAPGEGIVEQQQDR